jgi:hypothetical protein
MAGMKRPSSWSDPSVAYDVRDYTDVEVQVVGAPGVAYAPQRSLDGTTFVACNAYDLDGSPVTSISAAGIYSMDGGGYVKLATGSGSTVYIRAGV